jgi:hypothetical protein
MQDAITRSLRAEFWKGHLLAPQTPRKGDKAAIIKDHHGNETDALVKVTDDPVYGTIICHDCGQEVKGWVCEIQLLDDLGREPPPGVNVYAYPLNWLQRVLPLGHPDASQKQIALA